MVSAIARISTHTIHLFFFRLGRLFRFAKFTPENAIGSKSEDEQSNRLGNGLPKTVFFLFRRKWRTPIYIPVYIRVFLKPKNARKKNKSGRTLSLGVLSLPLLHLRAEVARRPFPADFPILKTFRTNSSSLHMWCKPISSGTILLRRRSKIHNLLP